MSDLKEVSQLKIQPKGKRKILVADDEMELVRMIRDFLEHQGFETFPAYEGVRAIEMAHKHKPDLILLDLKMPAVTGQSVLQALRSKLETEKIPVLILTGYPDVQQEALILQAGAQDFLVKPCPPEILLQKIQNLLEAKESSSKEE